MFKTTRQAFVSIADFCEKYNLVHIIFAAIILLMIANLILLPDLKYGPDSFAYFELSKSFFGEDFYHLNTLRGYFDIDHSASFPLLYPALIAALNAVFGEHYLNASFYNIGLMIFSYGLLLKIARLHSEDKLLNQTFALSIVMYMGYWEEVISGKSIPLAFSILLSAYYLYAIGKSRYLVVFLLGVTCLARFDILVFCLFATIYLTFKERKFMLLPCFMVGASPWISFSYSHFGSVWVTDNSWVALSSQPVYVTYFPAAAELTIFNDSWTWVQRIIGNFFEGTTKLIRKCLSNPVFTVALGYSLYFFFKDKAKQQISYHFILMAILVIGAVMTPYYLSGYFDTRYYYLSVFISTLVLFQHTHAQISKAFVPVMLLVILVLSAVPIAKKLVLYDQVIVNLDKRWGHIEQISQQHEAEPEVTYLICNAPDDALVWAMYGALTGNKTAIYPDNHEHVDWRAFRELVGPYRFVRLEGCEKPVYPEYAE